MYDGLHLDNPAFTTFDESDLEFDADGMVAPMPVDQCQNYPSETCSGDVWPRRSRSGLTESLRCDGCQEVLDERLDEVENRYPNRAPADFDPTYAGESWDGDY